MLPGIAARLRLQGGDYRRVRGVGKSCLLSRFADDDQRFNENHLSTIGAPGTVPEFQL